MKQNYKLFHSYTLRLALLYAIIFSASALILLFFFYFFTTAYMIQQVDDTITIEIQGIIERYDQEGPDGVATLLSDRVKAKQPTNDSIYLLTTYTLQPIVGNISNWPVNATVFEGDWLEFNLNVDQKSGDVHAVRAKKLLLPEKYGLLVGRDINQWVEAERRIRQVLIWTGALMVFLALVGGMILSRRTVRKIERINQTARSIMSGDMSRRVPLTNRNDDFDQLADNLNQMFDRIQELIEDIRRVSDNIAHDLRTPLTRLRQRLEDAKERSDPQSIASDDLQSAISEADSLLSTFNALLRIARIEAGQVTASFTTLDFRTLLEDIVEFYEPLAEDKSQTLLTNLPNPIETWGDRDLLFQTLINIVVNSIKYTPDHGEIMINLKRDTYSPTAIITIADNGPGIPKDERENVFRRFYRLDQSRTTQGNGLGLSMVSAVIEMHNGSIELHDNNPGLKTIIRLPIQQAPSNTDHETNP